jgi:hypothetical protein
VNIVLEVLFALLLTADTWLTYRIIESGKGVEVGWGARHYIGNKPITIALTAICFVALVGWLRLLGWWWVLIPVDLYMARLVYKNWKVLHGN